MNPSSSGVSKQEVVPRWQVGVREHLHDVQEISAGLALGPERLAAARPESHAAFGGALLERLLVHIPQHQDLQRRSVLDDHRKQSVSGLI